MAQTFRRHLGHESTLDHGHYTVATESGRPVLRCPACGLTYELPAGFNPDLSGRVNYAVQCKQTSCSFWDWVVLDDIWSDP